MKDAHFLHAITVFGIVAISVVFVGYATDTLPTDTPREMTTTSTDNIIGEAEDGCGCCKQRLAKFREFMEMRKQRKAAEQQALDAQQKVLK